MALITVAFFQDRYGGTDTDKISAHIDDVSAEVVDYLNTLDSDDTASDWTTATAPAGVQAVVARVVNRGMSNPFGVVQEGLGDHNISYTSGAAGGMLAPKDKRQLRRAAGLSAAKELGLDPYLPLVPTEIDEFVL